MYPPFELCQVRDASKKSLRKVILGNCPESEKSLKITDDLLLAHRQRYLTIIRHEITIFYLDEIVIFHIIRQAHIDYRIHSPLRKDCPKITFQFHQKRNKWKRRLNSAKAFPLEMRFRIKRLLPESNTKRNRQFSTIFFAVLLPWISVNNWRISLTSLRFILDVGVVQTSSFSWCTRFGNLLKLFVDTEPAQLGAHFNAASEDKLRIYKRATVDSQPVVRSSSHAIYSFWIRIIMPKCGEWKVFGPLTGLWSSHTSKTHRDNLHSDDWQIPFINWHHEMNIETCRKYSIFLYYWKLLLVD